MRSLVVLLPALLGASAEAAQETAFTLYRTSVMIENARLHVATFDAKDGRAYNEENCRTAADLFGRQSGVATRFWCELGRYRP